MEDPSLSYVESTVRLESFVGAAALVAALTGCQDPAGPSGVSSDCSPCLDPQILQVLATHAHDLSLSASLLAGHASAREMVCFFQAPGLSGDVAVPGTFITPAEICSDAVTFDPFCEENRCSSLSCTGEGAGWVVRYWLAEEASSSGFVFDSGRIDCAWKEGASGIEFTLQTAASDSVGRVWNADGGGTMEPDALQATETFSELCAAGPLTLTVRSSSSGDRATLGIGARVIAELDAGGQLVPTSSCR